MTVDEFVKGFDKQINDEAAVKYIRKHVVRPYVSYKEKVDQAERIIRSCFYTKEGDVELFHVNSPARYMLVTVALYQMYTDVEFNTESIITQFDVLEGHGCNDLLAEAIGVDYNRFMTVIQMCIDDLITNTRDLVGFMEEKTRVVEVVAKEMMDAFEERIQQDGETAKI